MIVRSGEFLLHEIMESLLWVKKFRYDLMWEKNTFPNYKIKGKKEKNGIEDIC